MHNPQIWYSVGKPTNLATARVDQLTWLEFVERFNEPPRSEEPHAQYLALDKKERNRLKESRGWFIGAPLKMGRRKNDMVLARQLVTLDFDDGITPEHLESLMNGNHPLCQYEFLLHSTRSHTPSAPRLRIILPSIISIEPEHYEAVARILVHSFDNSMTQVDPASFRPAQLMYMPTLSADQQYINKHNEGILLDPADLLNSWPDWWNHSSLPRSDTDTPANHSGKPLEDPALKKGLVGAFCRAFGIDEAIAEFLPEIYTDPENKGSEVRYTFQGASTTGGAINYGNKYLYSWHSTDPAYNMMCNAWDLVRIHRFGSLDGDIEQSESLKNRPSQKEMTAWAENLAQVQEKRVHDTLDITAMFSNVSEDTQQLIQQGSLEDRYKLTDSARHLLGMETLALHTQLGLPEIDGEEKPAPSHKDWMKNLTMGRGNELKKSLDNLILILTYDERLRGCCAYNAFRRELVYKRQIDSPVERIRPPKLRDTENGDIWLDKHDACIQAILSLPAGEGRVGYGLEMPMTTIRSALTTVAAQFRFHPVMKHLTEDLPEWDGIRRVERLWIDYLGCPDTPYYRETAKHTMVGAIARLFQPGLPFDHVPILIGSQGKRKSTFVWELPFRKWGGEFSAPLENQQLGVEQMSDKWIMEMPEIWSFRKSDMRAQKMFITRRVDKVRLAYAHRAEDYPRQVIFIGTTNEFQFLNDTENRRYWPIQVKTDVIDTDKLRENLPQIWVEARNMYSERYRTENSKTMYFHLSSAALIEARAIQNDTRMESVEDDEMLAVQDYLSQEVPISAVENALNSAGHPPSTPILRTAVTAKQLVMTISSRTPSDRDFDQAVKRVGRNMHRMTGWIKYSDWGRQNGHPGVDMLKLPGYGRGRAYVREDATYDEIQQRWKLAPVTHNTEDLKQSVL